MPKLRPFFEMTVHSVQGSHQGGPYFCAPYARLNPVTGPLVQLAANLSAIHAETARAGVPVKTGKEKSVIPSNFPLKQTISWRNAWTYTAQLPQCAAKWSRCLKNLSLASYTLPLAPFLLLLKLIPLLQLSLQLRNTQRMVTKPF